MNTSQIVFRTLSAADAHPFEYTPSADDMQKMKEALGLSALKKLRFQGTLTPGPGRDWTLDAQLGATVIQPCRVTLLPVTTRIDCLLYTSDAADD